MPSSQATHQLGLHYLEEGRSEKNFLLAVIWLSSPTSEDGSIHLYTWHKKKLETWGEIVSVEKSFLACVNSSMAQCTWPPLWRWVKFFILLSTISWSLKDLAKGDKEVNETMQFKVGQDQCDKEISKWAEISPLCAAERITAYSTDWKSEPFFIKWQRYLHLPLKKKVMPYFVKPDSF